MSLVRLLAVVAIASLSWLPAIAQSKSSDVDNLLAETEVNPATRASAARQQADPAFPSNLDQYDGQPFKFDGSGTIVPAHPVVFMTMPPLTTPMVDAGACYSIRSYVVARDRKDSDATHLVGYSTCRPANRYRVWKTAQPNTVQLTR
jgi:hypothetical protein